ncbi:MAG: DUF3344 domain-containing protein [Methanosarcinaceae archaeon]|nr:DUF3344 domain-containing protein [Methanosarcinaceae archaeon]
MILLINISPCLATYNFEGVPDNSRLNEITSGSIKGGLYVDAGDEKGLSITPYVEEFQVPGKSVKWARVYVGVWGGTEAKYGTLDLTVNGKEFDTVDLEGTADPGDGPGQNPAIYCSGHGIYWVAYDMGTNVSTGPVKVEAETGGTIDGRVYGIVLVAVYEDDNGQETKYWVEEGNINLHGTGWSGDMEATHEEAYANFSGNVDLNKYRTANLSVVYLCGSPGLADSLYFNEEQLSDEGDKNDIANSMNYFDLKFFDVLDFLDIENNGLTFKRDNEDYLHPVLAALCLRTDESGAEVNSSEVSLKVTIVPAISLEISPSALDFGNLSQGMTSEPQYITLKNSGGCSINVTAEVSDSSAGAELFSKGLLLDSLLWSEYSKVIGTGNQESTAVALKVPSSSGFGNKQGTITFWAEAA